MALFCGPYFNGGVKAGSGGAFVCNCTENISLVAELNLKFSEPKVYIITLPYIPPAMRYFSSIKERLSTLFLGKAIHSLFTPPFYY